MDLLVRVRTVSDVHAVTSPPNAVDLASELGRWRTLRRVSKLELALHAGTTQRHISYLERRGRSATQKLTVLCGLIEIPVRCA